ncbi:MAG: signal peptidase II [bacterium]
MTKQKTIWAVCAILALTALDQITKAMIITHFGTIGKGIPIIPGFFNLTYQVNTGVAFSQGSSLGVPAILLINLVVLAAFCYLVRPYLAIRGGLSSLCLIIAGAVGNLIDRFRLGHVTDFLDFHLGSLHWPVFNVADIAVVIGVLMLVVTIITAESKRPAPEGTSI